MSLNEKVAAALREVDEACPCDCVHDDGKARGVEAACDFCAPLHAAIRKYGDLREQAR